MKILEIRAARNIPTGLGSVMSDGKQVSLYLQSGRDPIVFTKGQTVTVRITLEDTGLLKLDWDVERGQ